MSRPLRSSEASERRALLVTGDRGQADQLGSIFQSLQHSAIAVPNAEAALTELTRGGINVLAAGALSAGMPAWDLCRLVRADSEFRDLPVVLFAAGGQDFEPLLECGADAVFLPPLDRDLCASTIEHLLESSSDPALRRQRAAQIITRELARINRRLQAAVDAIAASQGQLSRYTQRLETEADLSEGKYRALMGNAREGIVVTSADWVVLEANAGAEAKLGINRGKLLGRPLFDVPALAPYARSFFDELLTGAADTRELVLSDERAEVWLELSASPMSVGEQQLILVIARDVTERRRALEELLAKEAALRSAIAERDRIQVELVQAQKLEAVGQLAAGIAHEINTPTQYIGDNIHFLQLASVRTEPILQAFERLLEAVRSTGFEPDLVTAVDGTIKKARLPYLRAEVPRAVEQALEGVERVSTIVQALKEFSHPGSVSKSEIDINRALRTTATVARNEWKYVAEVEFQLDETLPRVPCLPGELNQALLNIIVNAAHAIGEKLGEEHTSKGKITIRTERCGEEVQISIADTGAGIPDPIKNQIFNPFFTTKKVGKGTGQGLTIARSVIVDKHEGRFSFESAVGIGTTFFIQLPLHDRSGEALTETHA